MLMPRIILGECGHKHLSPGKFCRKCGHRRPGVHMSVETTASVEATSSAEATTSVEATVSAEGNACAEATASAEATVSAEVTASAEAGTSADASTSAEATASAEATGSVGRPSKVKRFRSGWILLEDQTFIAPDGTKFATRNKASKYFNKNVTRLEPERKDGWQVYVDETNTHTDPRWSSLALVCSSQGICNQG